MIPLPMLTTAFRKVVLRGGSPYYYGRKYLEMARTPHELATGRRLAAEHHGRATAADVSLVRELRSTASLSWIATARSDRRAGERVHASPPRTPVDEPGEPKQLPAV